MLNVLPARKRARNRATARPPSANGSPINPVATAPRCAATSPLSAPPARMATAISALLSVRARPVRGPKCAAMPLVVLARKATASHPKAKAARHNPRCVARVTALPVALRVKAIASANRPVVPVMVKALLVPRCAVMVSPRKAARVTVNDPRSAPAMDSARPWKAVTASAHRAMPLAMVSVHQDKALRVKAKVLLPARKCVMVGSGHRKAADKLKASAHRHAARKAIARWNNAAKAKAARNARQRNVSKLQG